jgi:hypothetical protein
MNNFALLAEAGFVRWTCSFVGRYNEAGAYAHPGRGTLVRRGRDNAMTTQNPTEPLKIGTIVRIRNSGYGRARIVEYRGPLGSKGVRVYGVQVGKKPQSAYIEVLEEQLELESADTHGRCDPGDCSN